MAATVPTSDDDAAQRLIARIAAGDRAAFEEFYGAHARRVLAFVRDIVDSAELAEEIAGDAMIAVWRSAPTFRRRSRVMTWVLGIAHHKALDALRRRGVECVALEALADRAAPEPGPQERLERIDDRTALDDALRSLSLEHRTVLQLVYGFDCTHAEIATIVGCPIATVKTRLFYAKRNLRERMARDAHAEELA
jgi:RNA polymerase sigma-70 factor (ECF subfamily)